MPSPAEPADFHLPETGSVVVFDLEYTAWEGSMAARWSRPGEAREVVQIGAVRLDAARGLAETAEFQILVRPRLNPRLSDYFVRLTGITQEMVDCDGQSFAGGLTAFAAFVSDAAAILSNGRDHAVLLENCRINDVPCPLAAERFVDLAPWFLRRLGGERHVMSSELADCLGLAAAERAHDALGDARSVATALRHLLGNAFS
jgi:inhibitor of KinA sporulation pathway (predicted exonuclease)